MWSHEFAQVYDVKSNYVEEPAVVAVLKFKKAIKNRRFWITKNYIKNSFN